MGLSWLLVKFELHWGGVGTGGGGGGQGARGKQSTYDQDNKKKVEVLCCIYSAFGIDLAFGLSVKRKCFFFVLLRRQLCTCMYEEKRTI